jgi:hypothetical protein
VSVYTLLISLPCHVVTLCSPYCTLYLLCRCRRTCQSDICQARRMTCTVMYICIYTYTQMYTCIYIYTHTCMHIWSHDIRIYYSYQQSSIYIQYTCTWIYTHIHTRSTNSHTRPQTNAHISCTQQSASGYYPCSTVLVSM